LQLSLQVAITETFGYNLVVYVMFQEFALLSSGDW